MAVLLQLGFALKSQESSPHNKYKYGLQITILEGTCLFLKSCLPPSISNVHFSSTSVSFKRSLFPSVQCGPGLDAAAQRATELSREVTGSLVAKIFLFLFWYQSMDFPVHVYIWFLFPVSSRAQIKKTLVGFVLRCYLLPDCAARFHEKESDKPVVGELIPMDGTDERPSTCPSWKKKCSF